LLGGCTKRECFSRALLNGSAFDLNSERLKFIQASFQEDRSKQKNKQQ